MKIFATVRRVKSVLIWVSTLGLGAGLGFGVSVGGFMGYGSGEVVVGVVVFLAIVIPFGVVALALWAKAEMLEVLLSIEANTFALARERVEGGIRERSDRGD